MTPPRGAGPERFVHPAGPIPSALAAALARARVDCVILRRSPTPPRAAAAHALTLVTARAELARVDALLRPLGFIRTPEADGGGRRRYCAYEPSTDSWSRLDVATTLSYGPTAWPLHGGAGERLVARRRGRSLAPDDELVDIVLRCVLDHRAFAQPDRVRLRFLWQQLVETDPHARDAPTEVDRWLAPALGWADIGAAIGAERWEELLGRREAIARRLFRRAPATHLLAWAGAAWRRLCAPWYGMRARRGLVVALLGPDGSGKTTLADALTREEPLRARRIYLGTNREAGDTLRIMHWVARRRAATRGGRRGAAWVAGKVLGFACRLAEQRYRHALALRHRARGGIVVFDRYALDLTVNEQLHRAPTGRLARARNWMLHAGVLRPDLLLVLDAPGDVLYARKGEHCPAQLERMRRAYAALASRAPEVVMIDAAVDAAAVRRTVTSLLWSRCGAPPRDAARDGEAAGA